jgi:hypothetical protein
MPQSRQPVRLSPSDVREGIRSAIILAGACGAAAFPMMYYQTVHLIAPMLAKPPNPDQTMALTLFHALLIFAASLLCALVGFLYTPRLGLPGLKVLSWDRKFFALYLAAGLLTAPVAYFLLDMDLRARIPEYFPGQLGWALAQTLGRALAPEVIARFGLVTIGVYLLRWLRFAGHPWPAPLAVACFGVLEAWVGLERLHQQPGLNLFTLSCLGLAFVSNLVFGEVYLRRGLVPALVLRLGVELKYPLYALFLS